MTYALRRNFAERTLVWGDRALSTEHLNQLAGSKSDADQPPTIHYPYI